MLQPPSKNIYINLTHIISDSLGYISVTRFHTDNLISILLHHPETVLHPSAKHQVLPHQVLYMAGDRPGWVKVNIHLLEFMSEPRYWVLGIEKTASGYTRAR